MKRIVNLSLLVILLSGCFKSEEADLVVHNALIYSVDEQFSTYQAMAIKDGKIIELGPEREILNRYRAKETYDAQTRFVYPGFYDAHSHFLGYSRNQGEINLFGAKSFDEVVERIQKFVAKSDREWIVGRGWDHNKWEVKEFPNKALLDSLFPNRPVHLTRVDGHAVLVNSEALRRSQIDNTTQIEGGLIEKDENGELTGILLDRAEEYAGEAITPMSVDLQAKLIAETEKECFAEGLTSVTDAGLSVSDINFLDSLQKTGDVSIRVYAMLRQNEEAFEFMRNGPLKTENLHVSSVKIYADGALGSRGALLKQPYSDDSENIGLRLVSDSTLQKYASAALENGFQVCTHCIGDSANAFVLEVYAETLEGINDLRWRIEHAQVVSPEDLHYYKDFGIIASVQPTHASSDKGWAEDRLGPDRIAHAYAFNTLKNQLGWIPLGTDFPAEPMSPISTFYAAVFRKSPDGTDEAPFQPEEALSREDALRGITFWPALASFEEQEKGSLEPNKIADFVVMDTDLIRSSEERVLTSKVIATFLSGKRVH
ncbi:amidohydrolase [Cryomorphaceae bacterium 1068]|nr:amidohydrolase [Cryomorphaceae bacterium 1068]